MYAEAISEIIKEIVPVAWEAFNDYILNAVTFSAKEQKILRNYINSDIIKTLEKNENDSMEQFSDFSKSEKQDFFDKLNKM
jgi:predicted oxidoreductase (fatty acid repression mutant protein)